MAKEYNLSKRSDMRRFERDMHNNLMEQAQSAILNKSIQIECPNCHCKFMARVGTNVCPICRKTIDLNMNF